jgi:hypothetical protein
MLVDFEVNLYVLRPAGQKFKFLNYNALLSLHISRAVTLLYDYCALCYYLLTSTGLFHGYNLLY